MKMLALLFALISTQAFAHLAIISHDSTSSFNYQFKASDIGLSVGELTIKMLDDYQVPYQGTEQGFNSILNSPTGLDAMVIISDSEMKTYGWCFEINGEIPEVYPNEVFINSISDNVLWFWGFAHYKNGEWIVQCAKD
jgi:hypothetical protein